MSVSKPRPITEVGNGRLGFHLKYLCLKVRGNCADCQG